MLFLLSSLAGAATFDGSTIDADLIDDLVRYQDGDDLLAWSDCSDADGSGCVSLHLRTTGGAQSWVIRDTTCSTTLSEGCYNGYTVIGLIDHTLNNMNLSEGELSISTDIWGWESGSPVILETLGTELSANLTGGFDIMLIPESKPILAQTVGLVSMDEGFAGAKSDQDCWEIYGKLYRIIDHADIRELQGALEELGVSINGLTHDGSYSLYTTAKGDGLLQFSWRYRLLEHLNEALEECLEEQPGGTFPGPFPDNFCMVCDADVSVDRPYTVTDEDGNSESVDMAATFCESWTATEGDDLNGDGECDE